MAKLEPLAIPFRFDPEDFEVDHMILEETVKEAFKACASIIEGFPDVAMGGRYVRVASARVERRGHDLTVRVVYERPDHAAGVIKHDYEVFGIEPGTTEHEIWDRIRFVLSMKDYDDQEKH